MNSANQKLQDAQQKLYNSWVEWRKNIGQTDNADDGDDDSGSAEVRGAESMLLPSWNHHT